MMRISFVLPYAGPAGGIRVVATYADRLTRRGHKVVVVSTPRKVSPIREAAKYVLRREGVFAEPLRKRSYFDGLDVDHRIIDKARPVHDSDLPDADVVIATWWETAEWVAALSPSKGAKAYFIQHDEVWFDQRRELVEATWSLPLHKITVATWLVDLARIRSGDHDVTLVPNSVDHQVFFAAPRRKQQQPTIGMLYASGRLKGCDRAIQAIKIVRQRIPNLRLLSFGVRVPSRRLPLPRWAEFSLRPPEPKLRAIYSGCDVFVWASRREGFGLPILEAMACRTPVVSTRCGGPEDIIGDGVNGFLVDVEDVEGLASALESVLRLSNVSWRRLSDAAHRRAGVYTWDDATDLFEAGLQRAVEKSAQRQLVHAERAAPAAARP